MNKVATFKSLVSVDQNATFMVTEGAFPQDFHLILQALHNADFGEELSSTVDGMCPAANNSIKTVCCKLASFFSE